jgi:glycerol transport system ATP-binding protein
MSLRLEHVSRMVGGERWLDDVNLDLRSGSLNVLLGPTLAGKTSLLRVMAGLDRPTTGQVLVDGKDVTGMALQKRSVAMVYQQFINYPSFTVYDNIASPLRRQGMSRRDIDARVHQTASMLHIDNLLNRLPAELSGGQQQRCAIARALVKDAKLLLLDEPLVNLDYKLREELRSELQALFSRRDAIVVYATTEPAEALVMGGEVIVMNEGGVLQHGPTIDVYHRPASAAVALNFSDPPMNMIHGRIEDGTALLGAGVRLPLTHHLQGLPPGNYRFGVRANHLSVRRTDGHDVVIPGEVELAEISGSETFLHVHHNEVSWVVQQEGVHTHALGEPVRIYVSPGRLYAFGEDGRLRAAPDRRAG